MIQSSYDFTEEGCILSFFVVVVVVVVVVEIFTFFCLKTLKIIVKGQHSKFTKC